MGLSDLVLDGWTLLLLAPFIGSFLGVVVRRLPDGRSILRPGSRCEACGAALRARDLVPLVSWLAARGRCRHCGDPLGLFYPGIEMAALAIAAIALGIDEMPRVWLDCVLGWWLLALGWIDLRRWVLPDALTLPLIIIGLAAATLFNREGLIDRALGAAFGYLVLRAIAAAYRAVRGFEGLGRGDAKLLGAGGAWVGASLLPQVILCAALLALVTAGAMRLIGIRLHAQTAIPFGPFLALAIWIVWLYLPLSI